jgi:uncharacterized protein (DUF4213/DUF364 family)
MTAPMPSPKPATNLPAPALAPVLIAQLEAIAARFPPPRVARLHIPADAPGDEAPKDAKFCAIELQDGAFGLSYVLLGDTLDALTGARSGHSGERLAGADPLQLARRLDGGTPVERALALAAINAMTDAVWRQVGYQPPPAGNSLGDVRLTGHDHLGMIGFFPPLVHQVQAVGGRLSVLELDEAMVRRQQQRFPQVHITLERSALAVCNKVVGTSTMLLNDTLDAMLAAAPQADHLRCHRPLSRALAGCAVRPRRHAAGRHPRERWRGVRRRDGARGVLERGLAQVCDRPRKLAGMGAPAGLRCGRCADISRPHGR